MRSLLRLLSAMTRFEKLTLLLFSLMLLLSVLLMLRKFYIENTIEEPTIGGTYIEGSVGEIHQLNPWFTITNDVNRDIVSLVFAGLLRYDPKSGKIVEDLATMTVSADNRLYTLKLKENLFWHDTTKEDPHPVTSDDVMFTFTAMQDPAFPNPLLRQNFLGIEIEKIDARTVRFRLPNAYNFFPSNLTLGLLPARSFEGVAIEDLDQVLDFAYQPVGAGPYEFISLLQTDLSSEATLKLFERPSLSPVKLERIVFRIFPDYNSLLADIGNLDGVRLVPRNDDGEPILPSGFRPIPYTLPQYTALFFNLDKSILKDQALRLGLQLATDKQAIVDSLHESKIVDTPLLELNLGDWRYKFDPEAAQGALFQSEWNLPERIRLKKLLLERDANATGPLRFPERIVLLQTGAALTLTGSMKDLPTPLFVNGVKVQSGTIVRDRNIESIWKVKLETSGQTGALKNGTNIVRMTDSKQKIIDSAYIDRVTDAAALRRLRDEQTFIEKFVATAGNDRLTVSQLFLENGLLRKRIASDPVQIRVDEFGNPLTLRLLTSPSPAHYSKIAELIKKEWRAIGVDVRIEVPASPDEFQEKMLARDYDILLFGQSLLDNLDSYPYWHSSNAQDPSGDKSKLKLDAFNLAQYTSFEADSLLTIIRENPNEDARKRALDKLNNIIKRDTPAIFLYSPLYVYGHREKISGINLQKLSMHSDRFLTLTDWFIHTDRHFKLGKSWWSFFSWLPSLL